MRRLAQTLVRRTHAHWALADAAPATAATAWRPPPRALATAARAAPPCWSCGSAGAAQAAAAPSLFCGSCRAVQPPPARGGVDLFQLLGVPRTYAVDVADLDRRYKALQSVLHPDKHAAAGDQAAAAADAASAAVNTAYATLRCPLARAVYMLDGQTDPAEAEAGTLTDADLLMEVMEAREEVDAAARGSPELERLRAAAAARADAVAADVAAAFAAGDEAAAREATVRLRYATRLLQAVVDKM